MPHWCSRCAGPHALAQAAEDGGVVVGLALPLRAQIHVRVDVEHLQVWVALERALDEGVGDEVIAADRERG